MRSNETLTTVDSTVIKYMWMAINVCVHNEILTFDCILAHLSTAYYFSLQDYTYWRSIWEAGEFSKNRTVLQRSIQCEIFGTNFNKIPVHRHHLTSWKNLQQICLNSQICRAKLTPGRCETVDQYSNANNSTVKHIKQCHS